MSAALLRAWQRRGALASLLWPLSLLFALAAAARRGLYRAGILATRRVAVPVVVVGNVVAGGAGKTPVVMALLEHLRLRGLQAGVIARGYGRRGAACMEVHATTDPLAAGDEPLLVKRRCAVPVFVAARRVQAAQALLAAYPDTQVIVSDDGLQHLALGRDIEICVFDARGAGNGWLLPAGPLREPWPRRVDLVLRPDRLAGLGGHAVQRRLGEMAVRADGTRVALARLVDRPLHAVAGIADPEAFFRMLRERGLRLHGCLSLPDHDDFSGFDAPADAVLVCTEKDAAKLWRSHPDAWAVPLEVEVAPGFWEAFDRLLGAQLSSRHGPQTD